MKANAEKGKDEGMGRLREVLASYALGGGEVTVEQLVREVGGREKESTEGGNNE